jgi:hypothetical protein
MQLCWKRCSLKTSMLVPITLALSISGVNAVATTAADEAKPTSKSIQPGSSHTPPTLLETIGIVSTRPLSNSDLTKLHIKNGLVVDSVEGISALSGVQPGDILISINGRDTPFGNVDKLPSDFPTTIVLLVLRADERLPIAVQLPPRHRALFQH